MNDGGPPFIASKIQKTLEHTSAETIFGQSLVEVYFQFLVLSDIIGGEGLVADTAAGHQRAMELSRN